MTTSTVLTGMVMLSLCSSCQHFGIDASRIPPPSGERQEEQSSTSFEDADIVVIASPFASRKTDVTHSFKGFTRNVVADRWETEFLVHSVLKGNLSACRITLVHDLPQNEEAKGYAQFFCARFLFSESMGSGSIRVEAPCVYMIKLDRFVRGKYVLATDGVNASFSVEKVSSNWFFLEFGRNEEVSETGKLQRFTEDADSATITTRLATEHPLPKPSGESPL